jgi:solute carrier family 32 (vesicular inhibitory amino acid transporter)
VDRIKGLGHQLAEVAVRLFVITVIVIIAIIFPSFDRIMALVGSCLCFTICIIFPLAFYLKIFGEAVPFWERFADYILIIVSSVMALVGTVWAFLPTERL